MSDQPMSRLDELLIDRATGDLSAESGAELQGLLAEQMDSSTEDYEWIAAELTAAIMGEQLEPMPASLAAAVLDKTREAEPTPDISPATVKRPRGGLAAWSGWIAAAAALVGWLALPRTAEIPTPPPGPTIAEIRDGLIGAGADVQLAWTATEDPAASGATGDVVWSNTDQSGVMRFAGLEPNDPTEFQYQLWIFDGTRDDRFPVDGGVFDVAAGGEDVLVEIQAKIDVREPALFAVTIEQPGGVVVSDRERIVLVAQVG